MNLKNNNGGFIDIIHLKRDKVIATFFNLKILILSIITVHNS